MNFPQLTVSIAITVNPTAAIAVTLPRIFLSANILTLSGSGGAIGGGAATVTTHVVELDITGTGGAIGGGTASIEFGGTLSMTGTGGAKGSGAALTHDSKTYPVSGGAIGSGVAGFDTFSPAIFGTLSTTLPVLSATIAATTDSATARLTTITSSITVLDNVVATINALLIPSTASVLAGTYAIDAPLPLLTSSIDGAAGYAAEIVSTLPTVGADISGYAGYLAEIAATSTTIGCDIAGYSGYIASIDSVQKAIAVNITGMPGSSASIAAALPTITAAIDAGFGATGTISAGLPRMQAAISVLAQATVQQLVMVVGTHTNAVTTYEQYPFNSFFELGGRYYGTGPDGICQIDVGDTDAGAAISAGISTGLMQMGDSHQKHIAAAYMTLRTAGDLTMTITVDEGAEFDPVDLTMTAEQFVSFVQRRIIVPKGLRGKSWQFELNNVDGCDFDFGQLGLTVAASTRRI